MPVAGKDALRSLHAAIHYITAYIIGYSTIEPPAGTVELQ